MRRIDGQPDRDTANCNYPRLGQSDERRNSHCRPLRHPLRLIDVAGRSVQTVCGPARASLTYGGKSFDLPSGMCQPDWKQGYLVSFGVFIGGTSDVPGAPPSLTVAKADIGDLVSGRLDGHPWAIRGDKTLITVAPDGMSGAFSGPTTYDVPVEGTWTC